MEPIAVQSRGFYHAESLEENSQLMEQQMIDNYDSARVILPNNLMNNEDFPNRGFA